MLACNADDRQAGPMREREKFLTPLPKLSQVFDKIKEDKIPIF